jgi:hypothetical protein
MKGTRVAHHRFVTINGQRHDITELPLTSETSCDRCGRYLTEKTTVQVNAGLLGDAPHDVLLEICDNCIREAFPGLADIAAKVLARV